MRTPRTVFPFTITCILFLMSIAPLSLTGQWHAGYKGRYFSGGINMLVNTFPAAPLAMANAASQGFSLRPEINPAIELEVAVLKRLGVGVHASRRTLGVPYRHDITWTFKPHPASDWVSEPVPAGAFPYKWSRIGFDVFYYSHGYQAPYGKYLKLAITRSTVTLDSPQLYLQPFERDIALTEKLTIWMPSIGFGRKFLVHDRVWLGIGGQYTPDFKKIKYMYRNIIDEMTFSYSEDKTGYANKDSVSPINWSKGVSDDNDNSLDMRILMHQMVRLSLTMSVGFFF
jgi:hypothetical protein